MALKVFNDKSAASKAAAGQAANAIRRALRDRGQARIIAATAASQLLFLDTLTREPGIDWKRVEVFHLDEYIGLPITHPGSFRKMLLEQLVEKTGITKYHLLDGDGDAVEVVRRVGKDLASAPIDIAFLGIGENGHLAFNDPPADFEIEDPYLIVTLDEACRMQQVGEAWFAEADAPLGPWVYARKVVTHDDYSFYNPKQHAMLDADGGRTIYLEGTYTHTFSGNNDATPRYDYNQVMYRLDLSDARLALPAE